METVIFLLFALLAVASSLMVVMHRNPVYSTMSLVVTLFSVAVLFVLLGAPFIGALQILIYTGAILVLGKVATQTPWPSESRSVVPSTAKLGHAFLGEYLLPFEIVGMLLLVAVIGATVAARKPPQPDKPVEDLEP